MVEGTRHGYLDRLGLSWERLAAQHPSTVPCKVSGTGTGAEGAYRDLATGGIWFDAYAGLCAGAVGSCMSKLIDETKNV